MSVETGAIERLTFELPTVTLEALAWGPPDGRLALALHGFPDSAWTWRHLGPHLAERGWRVVAPFLRGYAPSGIPSDGVVGVGALMDDAVRIHQRFGSPAGAALIGHDWGGIAANALAAHPDSPFDSTVVLAVPNLRAFASRDVLPILPGQLRNSWYTLFNQIPRWPEARFGDLVTKLWRDWSPDYDATEDLALLRQSFPQMAHRTAAINYYRQFARSFVSNSGPYARWQSSLFGPPLRPVRYLQGAQDGCLSARMAPLNERVVAASGSEAVVVPGVGHFLQLEKPRVLNRVITDFIETSACSFEA